MSEIKTAEEILNEWEKTNNPFYPNTMKYTREHLIEFAKFHHSQFNISDGEIEKEAVQIIELLIWYGSIHTVTGVRYPEGTHEEALKRAANYLNRMRDQIFKTKEE